MLSHRCLSVATIAAIDQPIAAAGPERQNCGSTQLSNRLRGQPRPLVEIPQQIGLVRLQHRHGVQDRTGLTR